MKPTYFLQTPRLGFRRWAEGDASLAQALWGDPEVTRLFGGPFSHEQVRARLAREIAQQASHGLQYWPIFLLDDGEFAGCCGLRPYPHGQRMHELGFHLRPCHWGKGLASEAARAVIVYAFDELGADALFAGHHPDNMASAKALERLGFRFERHELYPPTGLLHPSYVLLRPPSGSESLTTS
jgi:RimJ/RimL family protein N-acetyltransferase